MHVLHEGRELFGAFPFSLRLESAGTCVPLLCIDSERNQPPRVFRAPAGTYRVVAEGEAKTDWHGRVVLPRGLGRAESDVVLRPGATQELTLVLADGAKLRVTLEGEIDASDMEAARAEASLALSPRELANAPFDVTADELLRAGTAELFLTAPARRGEPVLRIAGAFEGTSAAGRHALNRWPLGERNTSETLPAGTFQLVARLAGGREARAEVVLLPGETRHVRLRF